MTVGIYQITNRVNGKCYIGSSAEIQTRWKKHFQALRRGRHYNVILQRAFVKYGEDNFDTKVVEVVDDLVFLLAREQFWIWRVQPEYNIAKSAYCSNPKGSKLRSEHVKKIGDAQRGIPKLVMRGRKLSSDHKANMSAGKIELLALRKSQGKPHWNKGITVSDETRTKMSDNAKKLWADPAYRLKAIESRRKNLDAKKAAGIPHPSVGLEASDELKKLRSDMAKARVRVNGRFS